MMRRCALFLLLVLLAVGLAAGQKFNCFSLIAGKKATSDGSLLLGHNEDDGGQLFVSAFKVNAGDHRRNEALMARIDALLPANRASLGFLWLQLPNQEYADSFFNEKGVVVTSDACGSREDRAELVGNGIGYLLRRAIAEKARSAREAVKLAGDLIDHFGYSDSGRTYIIADSSEGWLLQVVRGKHWVAQRVADDEIAVIANCYTIGRVDLADKENFQGSPDIVDYAVKRDWYRPEPDVEFDFAKAYSEPDNYRSMENVLRQWRGTNLLADKDCQLTDRFPFSFKAKKRVQLSDFFRVLRDHLEGTDYDLTDRYRKGSPNATANRTICTDITQYSFVAQLREPSDTLPQEIANLAWIAFRRPDSNAYSPWYFSIGAAPDGYGRETAESALKNQFNPAAMHLGSDTDEPFFTFAKLSEQVDRQYRERIAKAQKVWKNFENYAQKDLRSKEKEFDYLLGVHRAAALEIISNYVQGLEYRKWFLAAGLLKEFRK